MTTMPKTLKSTGNQRVTTQILSLEQVENTDLLITEVDVRKGDFGATATFKGVRADGIIVNVRTYAWKIIEPLESAKRDEALPVVARFACVQGRWQIVDPEHPEAFKVDGDNGK